MSKLDPNELARQADFRRVPAYPDSLAQARRSRKAAARAFPAAGVRRRSPRAQDAACRGRGGPNAFLLQGGDVAPKAFAEHGADHIRDFFRVFLQMAVVLTTSLGAASKPVVKVGPHRRPVRQAAFAPTTPRPSATGVTLPRLSRRHHQRHRLHPGSACCPIQNGCCSPTGSRRRRSICCAPSRRAATPILPACMSGRWDS